MPKTDNEFPDRDMAPRPADPHGLAALVLVESLIHVLIERSVLSTAQAIDVLDTARVVQAELAEAADGAGDDLWGSHALLTAIAESLRRDTIGSGE